MKKYSTFLIFMPLIAILGCTNIKSTWVAKCLEQKKTMHGLMKAQTSLLSTAGLGQNSLDFMSDYDCKVISDKYSANCEKDTSELAATMKDIMYDQCMQIGQAKEVAATAEQHQAKEITARQVAAVATANAEDQKNWATVVSLLDDLKIKLESPNFDINGPEFKADEFKSGLQAVIGALPPAYESRRKDLDALVFSIASKDKTEILKSINDLKIDRQVAAPKSN